MIKNMHEIFDGSMFITYISTVLFGWLLEGQLIVYTTFM